MADDLPSRRSFGNCLADIHWLAQTQCANLETKYLEGIRAPRRYLVPTLVDAATSFFLENIGAPSLFYFSTPQLGQFISLDRAP